MNTIAIKDEFIKLGQALKLAGLCESGVEAKFAVQLIKERHKRKKNDK